MKRYQTLLALITWTFACRSTNHSQHANSEGQELRSTRPEQQNNILLLETCQAETDCALTIALGDENRSDGLRLIADCRLDDLPKTFHCINEGFAKEKSQTSLTFSQTSLLKLIFLKIKSESDAFDTQMRSCFDEKNLTATDQEYLNIARSIRDLSSFELLKDFDNKGTVNNQWLESLQPKSRLQLIETTPSISLEKTEKNPVKVTLYNTVTIEPRNDKGQTNVIEKIWEYLEDIRDLYSAGHAVLQVEAPSKKPIFFSYTGISQGDDAGDLSHLDKVPDHQKTTFYISGESYRDFLLNYRTSELSFSMKDPLQALDYERRKISSDILDTLQKESKNSHLAEDDELKKKLFSYLSERRSRLSLFLKNKISNSSAWNKTLVNNAFFKEDLPDFFPKTSIHYEYYAKQIVTYDTYDALLNRYLEGGSINIGAEIHRLDLKFKKDENRQKQFFDNLAEQFGIESEKTKELFLKHTDDLTYFKTGQVYFLNSLSNAKGEGTIPITTEHRKTVDEMYTYFSEATKHREYYTSNYDKEMRNGKYNCASAACTFLDRMTAGKVSRNDYIYFVTRYKTPQTLIDATTRTVKSLAPSSFSPRVRFKLSEEACNSETLVESYRRQLAFAYEYIGFFSLIRNTLTALTATP